MPSHPHEKAEPTGLERKLRVHLWAPAAFGAGGGISVFSGFFLKAIQNIHPSIHFESFIKNDTKELISKHQIDHTCHVAGAWPESFHLRTFVYLARVLAFGFIRRPDLIITTLSTYGFLARWLHHLLGIKYWIVAHGTEVWDLPNGRLRRSLEDADRVLAVSRFTRDRLLRELNLSPSQVTVLPNTFDNSRFRIAPKPQPLLAKLRLTKHQPVLLTVCRLLERYKGCDDVLRALPTLRESFPNLHYVIVGDGPDRPRLERIIIDEGLKDCVTVCGFVPDDQLCDYYNLCDVFLMPSESEGFGIVYLEALACGKPPIASKHSGAVDPLMDGRLGVLLEPNQKAELVDAVSAILRQTHPNERLFNPALLRKEVIGGFGFSKFREVLHRHLNHFLERELGECKTARPTEIPAEQIKDKV